MTYEEMHALKRRLGDEYRTLMTDLSKIPKEQRGKSKTFARIQKVSKELGELNKQLKALHSSNQESREVLISKVAAMLLSRSVLVDYPKGPIRDAAMELAKIMYLTRPELLHRFTTQQEIEF